MKKLNLLISTLILCLTVQSSFGQWTYRIVKNDFDGAFKKCYTETYNGGYLIMEVGDTLVQDSAVIRRPFFALSGTYFCDEYAVIDIVLTVKENPIKYEVNATKSSDNRMYYLSESVWTEQFTNDFKNATKCSIRVNQSYCEKDYYFFNMKGSAAAYSFITSN
jgi:hypothetical protein